LDGGKQKYPSQSPLLGSIMPQGSERLTVGGTDKSQEKFLNLTADVRKGTEFVPGHEMKNCFLVDGPNVVIAPKPEP
jgi:hypothetical protein